MPTTPTITTAIMTMLFSSPLSSDEGMWLFNEPPRSQWREKYGFEPSPAWLEHIQKSSVRFNNGGSGAFVSEDGLILSNHHVGADSLQKFGDEQHNYYRDGFQARTQAEEKRCLDLELNVLLSIEDVTARVNAAVKSEMTAEQAFQARRAVMAEIEKESLDKTSLRSDVVTLYEGGLYHLYRYKKYTDVRLVFAPEYQIAFYGGDPDNFEYPRFDLDICLFRAYENDQPARVEHYLKWSRNGVSDGELVLVSGHPGHTSRMLTLAALEYQRDVALPYRLAYLHRLEVALQAYSGRSEESGRRAKQALFGTQNSRKAREGLQAGLLDPSLMNRKRLAESQLRELVGQSPEFKSAATAWDEIAAALEVTRHQALEYSLLEEAHGLGGTLFRIARTLIRSVEERPKASGERLREYRDSNRESLELALFSTEPLYDDFEQIKLANSLTWLAEKLGYAHPLVQKVLAGKSPRDRAADLVKQTQVKSVAYRKRVYAGDPALLNGLHDPLIDLARWVDEPARAVRKIMETQEEIERQAYARIAQAKFRLEKEHPYPDATFTLRLAYGAVKGYEQDGQTLPFQTTLAGLYERSTAHQNRPPFDLPASWVKQKSRLKLSTPFNFVSTADIIGGNSGSPVINRNGEYVGLIFDGNIQSLVLDVIYTDVQARAVAVNSQAIIEALRRVYGAGRLADELWNGSRPKTKK